MKFVDIFRLTIKSLLYRKLRSWLTILGIIIGISAVVALVSLGDVIQESVNYQLSGLGGDKIIIMPGLTKQIFSRQADMSTSATSQIIQIKKPVKPLTEKEANTLLKLPNIKAVSSVVRKTLNISFRGETKTNDVLFINPLEYYNVETFSMLEGRWLSSGDRSSCVLGYSVANDLFSQKIKIGDIIKINGKICKVIGIIKKQGGIVSNDDYIFINLNSIKSFTDYNDELTSIRIRVKDTSLLEETEKQIETTLLRLHKTKEKDFTIISFANIKEQVNSVLLIIRVFLAGIAAISLLVGGIGISNTMFTSVMERTREIGILKAIGARKKDIEYLFLAESTIMSAVGGFVGIILGIILSSGVVWIMPRVFDMPSDVIESMHLVITPSLILFSLIISLAIGILSGFLPARKAAGYDPIKAIWYE